MWIIDRFEETIAVIETDDGMTEIPRSQILGDAREGDILRQNPDGSYQTDTAATQARREKLAARTPVATIPTALPPMVANAV